jgi:hypothetical protein
MNSTYTVEHTDHAIILRGMAPMDDWLAVAKLAKKRFGKRGVIDAGLSHPMGGWVFTDAAGSAKMRAELDAANADLPPMERWLKGYDTGCSSMTIAVVLTDVNTPALYRDHIGDVPHDADDFGRCLRLLETMPEFATRLQGVADEYPIWQPLVSAWDELTGLYEAGALSELSDMIRELTVEKP